MHYHCHYCTTFTTPGNKTRTSLQSLVKCGQDEGRSRQGQLPDHFILPIAYITVDNLTNKVPLPTLTTVCTLTFLTIFTTTPSPPPSLHPTALFLSTQTMSVQMWSQSQVKCQTVPVTIITTCCFFCCCQNY